MKTYLQAYFDELKRLILAKCGITRIVPADCYRLAIEIKAATHKRVSETTLKRVFGFAASVHQPSAFTLNALAEYCGFDSWDDFYRQMEENKVHSSHQKSWQEISASATKISLFNIQSNKHKCGIPYHKTIDRRRWGEFIQHFQHSDAAVGILSGPAGYGKTIAATRWVERQLSLRNDDNNDIFLFTTSLSLLQGTAYGYHFGRWLAHLLGIGSTEMLDKFMEDHRDSAPGRFYMVIDELQTDLIADRQFYAIFTQFADMVRHFAQYKWFRIVIVLRTATLYKYETLIKDTAGDPMWYSIFSRTAASQYANMQPFSDAELYELSLKFQPMTPVKSLLATKSILKRPLFLQYFYERYGDELNLSQISLFDEYLVVAQYIKKKIFNGVNTIAKQAVMEELTEFVEEAETTLYANWNCVYNAIKQYRTGYNDLLYAGVILEKGTGYNQLRQQTRIEFPSPVLVAYFQALKLFNEQHTVSDLINKLNQSTSCAELKISKLKWLLLFYLETGDATLLDHLEQIAFIKRDPTLLMAFACDGLHKFSQKNTKSSTDTHPKPNLNVADSPFIAYVCRFPFFQTDFRTCVQKLLDFDLAAEQEIVLRSKLAIDALMKWEESALLEQLGKLAKIPVHAYSGFLINPFRALSFLYRYFKDHTVEPAMINELDQLSSKLCGVHDWKYNQIIDILGYLLVRVTSNSKIARYYSEIIHRKLQTLDSDRILEADLTSMLCALYLLECHDERGAAQCVSQLSENAKQHPIIHLLYTFYNIHLLKLKGKCYNAFLADAETLCREHGSKLLEAYCSLLALNDLPKIQKLRKISLIKRQLSAQGQTQ